jgi:hypothetical protein
MRWFGIRTPHLVASAKARPVRNRPLGWTGWDLLAVSPGRRRDSRLESAARYASSALKGAYQGRFDTS